MNASEFACRAALLEVAAQLSWRLIVQNMLFRIRERFGVMCYTGPRKDYASTHSCCPNNGLAGDLALFISTKLVASGRRKVCVYVRMQTHAEIMVGSSEIMVGAFGSTANPFV